jgi:processive 1,2-diacylglycerol beta-glucosyltransferase
MNVLIVSASMGAGHDGAARELSRRLERDGHSATTVDFLDAVPARCGILVRLGYEWQLRLAPWAYEATYRMWFALPFMTGPLIWLVGLLTSRRLQKWARRTNADVVVSTYPLASLAFGRMRQRGRIRIPVVTFITDFAVHPLWTHRGVDLHLAVHPQAAAAATARTGGRAESPGPLVADRFRSRLVDRGAARDRLGLPHDKTVVLLVAGSWGIGDLERTFDEVAEAGSFLPLAVCGNNKRLRRRLAAKNTGLVLGWTDEMPALMAAADVLVENAGGLTCMEAFASGLPVLTYRPIAGHGRGNALDMARAGVATYVGPHGELDEALEGAIGVDGLLRADAARTMFCGDAATDVVAEAVRSREVVRLDGRRPMVAARVRQGIAAAMASAAVLYGLVVVGVGTAAAHGVAVARPPHHALAAYVGVRLNPDELADPRVQAALGSDHVTAIVSGRMATEQPNAMAGLETAGVDVANGGWGGKWGFRWSRAHSDVVRSARAIQAATNEPMRLFVPARPVDGFDLATAQLTKERIVVGSDADAATLSGVPALHAGHIYVIDGRRLNTSALLTLLADLPQAATAADVDVLPLESLLPPASSSQMAPGRPAVRAV